MSDARPAALYFGKVMHARLKPVAHRFSYSVFSLLIDIGALDAAGRQSVFFSVNRFNLLSFKERDHGDGAARGLAAHIAGVLAQAGVRLPGGRTELLCYPRVLGFVFNPLSVFYCYDADGALGALIYEVRNTFGDKHSYVAPVRAGELGGAGLRQERDKLFYVSPFLDQKLRYRFRLTPPGDRLALRILETDAAGPIFAAAFSSARADLTTGVALRAFVSLPLMTLKVVAGIHYEALRLWLKGARFHSRPAPPLPHSLDGVETRLSPSPAPNNFAPHSSQA